MRTQEEIEEQLNLAADLPCEGTSKWPGESYEAGVENALLWVLDQTDAARPNG